MKGIFIAYDQAYNMEIADALDKLSCRGFTMWQDIAGRGSETGEPHLGNHAWPTMNNAILTFVQGTRKLLPLALELSSGTSRSHTKMLK